MVYFSILSAMIYTSLTILPALQGIPAGQIPFSLDLLVTLFLSSPTTRNLWQLRMCLCMSMQADNLHNLTHLGTHNLSCYMHP